MHRASWSRGQNLVTIWACLLSHGEYCRAWRLWISVEC